MDDRYELSAGGDLPPLRLHARTATQRRSRSTSARHRRRAAIRVEESRGYESRGDLWSPGYFRVDSDAGDDGDAGRLDRAVGDDRARSTPAEALRRRARAPPAAARGAPARGARRASAPSWCWPPTSSSSRPAGRVEDAARARAAGDEVRTVIAGYHWFTDWGRDTMISLEGLTLATGRHAEAGYILRTFAHYVRDGLIPNLFPEGEQRGPLSHRRRDALVLPRARPLPRADRRPRRRCSCCCPTLHRHRRAPPARHALRHRRRSRPTACCARAPRATSSPGWTPRSATGS